MDAVTDYEDQQNVCGTTMHTSPGILLPIVSTTQLAPEKKIIIIISSNPR